MVNSHLNSSFGKASNAVSGSGCSNLGPASGDMNWGVLNSTANSGPSVGASSLVTDANSALSGGPNLQRSASINTESYLRLPASPMSFSSNNISVSGSSAMDGSSIVQQSSHQDQGSQQMQQRQQGASSATSQLTPRTGQVPLSTGPQFSNSLTQEQSYLSQMHKKPRLDIKREDSLPQQVIQQLLHRQDSMQLQGHNPQLQALIQQQRLLQRQQQPQQILQSLPQIQRAQLQQQLQQQQLRHLQQQGMQPMSIMKRPYENGVCARRLMQYMFHQRHRPTDNPIIYWKKFVAEYFAPRAKKRWCLSLYDNVGQHALGVFPQAAMDAWQCDICGSKSGRGFEATYEVLPRLNKVKFDSGVIDELLFLDMPRECRLSTGIMMLEYGKAVQESVYEQLRVVREGQLRVIFSSDLKILSWEFCARRHEELFPRRLLAPQVNQLLQVAQKYQATVTESGSTGVSPQDLQSNCNLFLTAGRQLVRNLESQSLNDLGFSKRFVRCLQIAEVVNSLKDLMILTRDQNMGPIESLKNFAKQAAAAKLQMQKMQEIEQQAIAQGLTNDRTALNKVMAMHPGLNGQINNNNQLGGGGIVNSSAQTAMALSNYQNLLRQNSMNSNPTVTQQDSSCSFNSSSQAQSAPFQGPSSSIPGSMQNVQGNGFLFPNQLMQQQALSPNILLQQNHPQSSPGNQNLQQHMIQQLLQEMMSSSGGGRVQQQPQHQPSTQSLAAHSVNGTAGDEVFDAVSGNVGGLVVKPGSSPMIGNGVGYAKNTTSAVANASSGIAGGLLNRSNSFKGTSNVNSMVASTDTLNQKTNDILQNLHLPEMVQDISQEFPDWDV